MILQIKTEKELLAKIDKLEAQIVELQKQNKANLKSNQSSNLESDILEKINKYVTLEFVNKLYKARK